MPTYLMLQSALLWLIFLMPANAATSVIRCETAQGQVRFTEQTCAAGERQLEQLIKTNSPIQLGVKPRTDNTTSRASVRGIDSPQSHCQTGLDSQQLRRAIVKQELHAGMTQAQVSAALGTPSQISHRNSRTQYLYQPNQGKNLRLQFDEKGCLKR